MSGVKEILYQFLPSSVSGLRHSELEVLSLLRLISIIMSCA